MSAKFFLGGLSKKTVTQDLKDYFSKYGDIDDAIVMVSNGESRGFGFVTFADGARAISLGILSQDNVIHDRRIDVKSCIPESIDTNVRTKSVRISNLNPNTPNTTISAHFGKFGNVSNVSRETGTSAVVEFASEDQAENAFRAPAHDIDGASLTVEKHGGVVVKVQRRERQSEGRGGPLRDDRRGQDRNPYPQHRPDGGYGYPRQDNTGYAQQPGGYSYPAPQEQYNPYAAQPQPYGQPQAYGQPYGAYAQSQQGYPAQQYGQQYGQSYGGYQATQQQSYVGAGVGRSGRGSTDNADAGSKIFVGGLSEQTGDQSLQSYFSRFGDVTSAEVKMQDGRSRKFGFVVFTQPFAVQQALAQKFHNIDGKQVEVKQSDGGNRR
jgi:RNA recognition motif-containing protein